MKKIMFLGVSLLTVGVLAACSTTTTPTKKDTSAKTEQSTTESSSEAKETTYKVGDTIVFDGYAEITITGAEWTDERNQFEDSQPERVLKVTYNAKNLSDDDYVIGSDMELYVGGQKMESYANTNTFDTISKGRTFEGAVQHFGVNGTGEIEIEIEPAFAFDAEPAIVKLDIQ